MKRIVKYILGLMTMAVGVVLMKKAALGITPITSLPLALNEVLPVLSLGNWTILFHILCILAIMVITKKADVKTLLMFPVGIGFGYFIDLLLWIFRMETDLIAVRILLLGLGIPVSGLGVALINDADLMLPSPDGLIRTIAAHYNKRYPIVKIIGDCTWVAAAAVIELSVLHRLAAVNIGTIASALLVGKTIQLWNRLLFSPKSSAAENSAVTTDRM
ncbi:MAG: YitT family protein [Oscillospiraceae bacterium]